MNKRGVGQQRLPSASSKNGAAAPVSSMTIKRDQRNNRNRHNNVGIMRMQDQDDVSMLVDSQEQPVELVESDDAEDDGEGELHTVVHVQGLSAGYPEGINTEQDADALHISPPAPSVFDDDLRQNGAEQLISRLRQLLRF